MRRLVRAVLCLYGRHVRGYLLSQGFNADAYRCKACGRIYRD